MLERILHGHLLLKDRPLIYQETAQGRQFDTFYFSMMVFSCLLALLGLLMNSPAIIIGAMLISPLIGPVLACGLALATAEWPAGRKAARNVVFSIIEVVVIAALATKLSPLREATPEILARTNPNIMDLLVAFFSGLAGTLAACSRRAGASVIPGVAIATAVMPPLATTGYGIATSQWQVAGGSFMLFFTNLTAIMLSSSLVFALAGFRPQPQVTGEPHPWLVRWRIVMAFAVMIALAVPLARTLVSTVQQVRVRNTAQSVLREILTGSNRHLDRVAVRVRSDRVNMDAVIQTRKYIEAPELHAMRDALASRLGRPVTLDVQQVQLATEARPADVIRAGVVRQAAVEPAPEPVVQVDKIQKQLGTALADILRPLSVSDVQVLAVGRQEDGSFQLEVVGKAAQPSSEDVWRVAAAALTRVAGGPVRLRCHVVLESERLRLRYANGAQRLTAAELRNLRRFAAAHKRPDYLFAIAFAANARADLMQSRSQQVVDALPAPVVSLANLEPESDESMLAIYTVQRFEAADAPLPLPPAPPKATASAQ